MEINEEKLCPKLQKWIREGTRDKRTVTIRFAFHKDYEEAARYLGEIGMIIVSCGPTVIVATSDSESIKKAICLSWITKIDLPQKLDMKSRLSKM